MPPPSRKILANMIRKQTTAKVNPKHYPAPFELIDAWEKMGGLIPAIVQDRRLELDRNRGNDRICRRLYDYEPFLNE